MNRNLWILPIFLLVAACRTAGAGGDAKPDHAPDKSATTAPAVHAHVGTDPGGAGMGTPLAPRGGDKLAAFAGGCFWGVEDVFRQVPGVVATAVGYSGGHTTNPSYEDVCTHTTGHAETVLVEFDPQRVTYAQLLRAFWDTHDPTTLNRQGPDVGDNYRSEIFFLSPEQEATAKASLEAEQKNHERAITTLVKPLGPFWKAEDYHQQFDEKQGRESCPVPKRHKAS